MTRPAILAPTLLEYLAARFAWPGADITWCGAGLTRLSRLEKNRLYLVCGLAGGLARDVRSGSLLVPERVGLADGTCFDCDRDAVGALSSAMRCRGVVVDARPMLTADAMVVGQARSQWAACGFAGVDMETGKLARMGARVATARIVLDGADREISDRWQHPFRALTHFSSWQELSWLARTAPRYSWAAARAMKAGVKMLSVDRFR